MTTPIRTPKRLWKTFEKKDVQSQAAILGCVRQLREDWRDNGLHAKKMEGRFVDGNPVFEARVTRSDRVTFYWDDDTIVLENHCHHDEALRRRR